MTAEVFLQREDMQPTGSYKTRGVQRFLSSLDRSIHTVVTLSAGNMARSLAQMASVRKLKVEAYVPDTIPEIKRETLEKLGVSVSPIPMTALWEMVESPPLMPAGVRLLHPIDSEEILVGYGGIARDILHYCPTVTEVVLPFGVGGLTLGVASELKRRRPEVRVVVAERSDVSPLFQAARNKAPILVDMKRSWIDAIGTPRVLPRVYDRLFGNQPLIDEVRLVDSESARSTAKRMLERAITLEGAAAIALAAAQGDYKMSMTLSTLERKKRGKVVCILTGRNIDPATILQ